jgi:hypothetical protein
MVARKQSRTLQGRFAQKAATCDTLSVAAFRAVLVALENA